MAATPTLPDPIEASVHGYITANVLRSPELGGDLAGDTPLMTGGILDERDALELAAHLEGRWRIRIPAEAITPRHFDSILSIAAAVRARLAGDPIGGPARSGLTPVRGGADEWEVWHRLLQFRVRCGSQRDARTVLRAMRRAWPGA